MAWRCSGASNAELVDNLAKAGIIKSPRLARAMKNVDRAHYVPNKARAYDDSPQTIGYGATISAPHMHAHATEHLLPYLRPGGTVLDVGSGSGYLLGIFHELVSDSADSTTVPAPPTSLSDAIASSSAVTSPPKDSRPYVLGIDHIEELVEIAKKALIRDPNSEPAKACKSQPPEIEVITGDGRQGAPPDKLPSRGFDAIHVGAAAPTYPEALVKQLASPGRLFVPIGTHSQAVWCIDKDREGNVTKNELFGVRYVPLTEKSKQYP